MSEQNKPSTAEQKHYEVIKKQQEAMLAAMTPKQRKKYEKDLKKYDRNLRLLLV